MKSNEVAPNHRIGRIVNLTPHKLKILSSDEEVGWVEIPSDGVCRVKTESVSAGEVDAQGLPFKLVKTAFGVVEGFEEHRGRKGFETVTYIVSRIAAAAIKEQIGELESYEMLACPADLVRDGDGNVIGASTLELQ